MITLGQLLMYVGYDTTVVLVQHGTEEEICIFTESEELEYTKEYEKVAPHLEREVMIISTTPASYLYIEIL
ncbi:Phage protein [Enterococcus phage Q69]|nr:Phage protein [Enterococcus phage Q69]